MQNLMHKVSIAVIAGAVLLFGAAQVLAYSSPVIQSSGMELYQPAEQPPRPSRFVYTYANAPVIVYNQQTTQSTTTTTSRSSDSAIAGSNNGPGLLQEIVDRVGPITPVDESETMCANETVTSTIGYRNTTGFDSVNTTITAIFPEGIDFTASSIENGNYNERTRTLTIIVGPLAKNQSGTLYLTMKGNRMVEQELTTSVQVHVTFTKADGTEKTLTNYINFSSEKCANNLGALALANGFFPQTFFGWLILAVILCLIIYVSRQFFKKGDGHGHGGGHDDGHGHPSSAAQMEDKAWNSEHS
jgi:hypothetical protein